MFIVHGNIMALYRYYPYSKGGERNPNFDRNCGKALDLKHYRQRAINNLVNELNELVPKKTVICVVPSSKKGTGEKSGIGMVAYRLSKKGRIRGLNCIERIESIRMVSIGGTRGPLIHETTINVKNEFIFQNKEIWLLDDIVTTGNTLKVCAKKLIGKGALKVQCLAVAATVYEKELKG